MKRENETNQLPVIYTKILKGKRKSFVRLVLPSIAVIGVLAYGGVYMYKHGGFEMTTGYEWLNKEEQSKKAVQSDYTPSNEPTTKYELAVNEITRRSNHRSRDRKSNQKLKDIEIQIEGRVRETRFPEYMEDMLATTIDKYPESIYSDNIDYGLLGTVLRNRLNAISGDGYDIRDNQFATSEEGLPHRENILSYQNHIRSYMDYMPESAINEDREGYVARDRYKRGDAEQMPIIRVSQGTYVNQTQDEEQDIQTIYGELLSTKKVRDSEKVGFVPHSNNKGGAIGAPVPTIDQQIINKMRLKIPLTNEDIISIKRVYDEYERALNAQPEIDHKIRKIKYSEGVINEISVAKNSISTISFLDSKGNPYPVQTAFPKKYESLFTVSIPGSTDNNGAGLNSLTNASEENTAVRNDVNTIQIQSQANNGSGNISIMLVGKALPAPFKINLTETINDAKTIVMLDRLAPGVPEEVAVNSRNDSQLCEGEVLAESILDGIIPSSLKRIEIDNPTFQVYQSPAGLYLRSKQKVESPQCDCILFGTESMSVCRVPSNTSNVLYLDKMTSRVETLLINQ